MNLEVFVTKEKLKRKAINFDLDTKKLSINYGKSRRNAYREIGNFLEKNGFKHRQWSGYVSEKKMSHMEIEKLNIKMFKNFPWLISCARRFDVTDLGKNYNLIKMYNAYIKKIENGSQRKNIEETRKLFSKDEFKNFVNEAVKQKESSNERKINDVSKVKRSNERKR